MSETRLATKREERRFGRQAGRRYRHMVGINCNEIRGISARSGPCWRCLWWSITGKHRAALRKERARREAIRNCAHQNRRPNPAVRNDNPNVSGAEICDDCGVGLAVWKRSA